MSEQGKKAKKAPAGLLAQRVDGKKLKAEIDALMDKIDQALLERVR